MLSISEKLTMKFTNLSTLVKNQPRWVSTLSVTFKPKYLLFEQTLNKFSLESRYINFRKPNNEIYEFKYFCQEATKMSINVIGYF